MYGRNVCTYLFSYCAIESREKSVSSLLSIIKWRGNLSTIRFCPGHQTRMPGGQSCLKVWIWNSQICYFVFNFYHQNLVLILALRQNFWWPWAHNLGSLLMRSSDLKLTDVFPAPNFHLGRHFLKPVIKSSLCYIIPFCWQRNRCSLKVVFRAFSIAFLVRTVEWQPQLGPQEHLPPFSLTTATLKTDRPRKMGHGFCLNYQPLLLSILSF